MRQFSNSRIGLKPLCAAVPSERSVRVAVIGLGYVGLPLAAAVASTGANVIGIDIDLEKVKVVNTGQSPLQGQEPGLGELLKEQVSKGHLRASLEASAVSGADVVAVCVETPIDPTTHDPSYKALKAALAEIAPVLKRGALVSIESTLAPGTMEGVVRPALERGSKRTVGRDLYLVHCPERLTTGKLLHHLTELPWLLVSPAVQSKPELIPTAREVNDFMPRRMARIVEEALAAAGRKIKGSRVAVLGFSYRENTDDTRNSPAKTMIQELRRRGADIAIHDPFARSERGYAVLRDIKAATKGADCIALVTAHDAYRKLDLKALGRRMRHLALVDGRNLYAGPDVVKMGFVYPA